VSAGPAEGQPLDDELEAEYGQLLEVYWPKLVALCMARGRSRAAAEDIVAEAFMRLHERRGQVQHKGAYLSVIVSNLLKRPTREHPVAEPIGRGSSHGALAELEGHELVRQALWVTPGSLET
jgi:DNA-directed RNA polymerase specialized sigma24 family protein